jgi:amino acid adenylation domain-containing protein
MRKTRQNSDHPGPTRLNRAQSDSGLGLDQLIEGEIQDLFIRADLIVDWAIANQSLASGDHEYQVYYVPSPGVLLSQVERELQAVLALHPADLLRLIPVSSIPLNDSGTADLERLQSLGAVDEAILRNVENDFNQDFSEPRCVFIKTEHHPDMPLLHDTDLFSGNLPGCDSISPGQTPKAEEDGVSASETAVIAISQGDELRTKDLPANLVECLENTAGKYPDREMVFIDSQSNRSRLSYSELLRLARKAAGGLRQEGMQAEEPVIFQFSDNRKFVIAFWACQIAGLVPVPLASVRDCDPSDSKCQKLINAWKLLDRPHIFSERDSITFIENIFDKNLKLSPACLPLESIQSSSIQPAPDDPDAACRALILLTSGSTGQPKGVIHNHQTLLSNSAANIQMGNFSDCEFSLNWMPLDHVGGIVFFHLRDVLLGARQLHVGTELIMKQPVRWLQFIHEFRITNTWAPNFAFGLINSASEEILSLDLDLSCLKCILNGGEAVVARTAWRFLKLLAGKRLLPDCMVPAWGMSETAGGVILCHQFNLENSTDDQKAVSVGMPIPGFSFRIVDSNNRVVRDNEKGRLQVKGLCLTPGYYQSELNEQAFTDDGWFNTGDLGFLHDGALTVTGREKDEIIIHGVNYSCSEIESVLEELPGVAVSYTAACPVRKDDAESDELAVFLSQDDSSGIEIKDLLLGIKVKIGETFGIDSPYIITLEKSQIPKTEIGKIARSKLVDQFHKGAFDHLVKSMDLMTQNRKTCPSWFCSKEWIPRLPRVGNNSAGAPSLLLFANDSEFRHSFIRKCEEQNHRVICVESGSEYLDSDAHGRPCVVRVDNDEDYSRLIGDLIKLDILPEFIVHAWAWECELEHPVQADLIEEVSCRGALSLIRLLKALDTERKHDSQVRLCVVTRHVHERGLEDPVDFVNASISGLIRSATLEISNLEVCHVDLSGSNGRESADHVLTEIGSLWIDREVAYFNGVRHILRLNWAEPVPGKPAGCRILQNGCYVISGGLGGIGSVICRFLMEQFDVRLLILGTTRLTDGLRQPEGRNADSRFQEKVDALNLLKATGHDLTYAPCDLGNYDELSGIVEDAENRWNQKIDGIIHLAGTYHEQKLICETDQGWMKLLLPKLQGAMNLHRILNDREGGIFISFGSVAGTFGGRGIAGYSASNCALEAFTAWQNRQANIHAYYLAWSSWSGVGMSRGYEHMDLAWSSSRGYLPIPEQDALKSLQAALWQNWSNVIIGIDPGHRFVARFSRDPVFPLQKITAIGLAGDEDEILGTLQNGVAERIGDKTRVEMHFIDKFPLDDHGMIDRKDLSDSLNRAASGDEDYTGRDEFERRILKIWKSVLKINRIGTNTTFFKLGGNSIKATRILSLLQVEFDVELPISFFFKNPTVSRQGQILRILTENIRPVGENISAEINSGRMEDSAAESGWLKDDGSRVVVASFAQQRLWVMNQLTGEIDPYILSFAHRVEGKLNIEALKSSLNKLVERHESLRTLFEIVDGHPVQVIRDHVELTVPIVRFEDTIDRDDKLRNLIDREAREKFDLAGDLPIRARIIKLDVEEHIFLLTMHHIAVDGWSLGIVFSELGEFYSAEIQGRIPGLPDLAVQYADFSAWQSTRIQEEEIKRQREYWIEHLKDLPPTQLPYDYAKDSTPNYDGALKQVVIPPDLSSGLRAISEKDGTTLFMSMLSGLSILLGKYLQRQQVVVGAAIAGRNKPELEDLIGFFVNMLVMRINLGGDPSIREVLSQVRESSLKGYDNQDYPFEKIVAELNPDRDLKANKLFQIVFTVQNAPREALKLPGMKIYSVGIEQQYVRFDMEIHVLESPDNIIINIIYKTGRFKPETIHRFADLYINVLRFIVENPDKRISTISLMSEPDRLEVIEKWNGEVSGLPHTESLPILFEKVVASNPDATALEFGACRLSYGELNEHANRLAQRLRKLGVGRGDPVAVYMERSARLLVTLLGILKSGGAYVPLDASYPTQMLEYMLEDIGADVVITQGSMRDVLPSLAEDDARTVLELDERFSQVREESSANPEVVNEPSDLAYVIHTSGSTGRPKGVCVEHEAISRLVLGTNYVDIGPGACIAQLSNSSFDAATFEIWGAWLNGARLVGYTKEQVLASRSFATSLVEDGVSTMFLTTALFNQLAREEPGIYGTLDSVLFGGEACDPSVVRSILEKDPPRRLLHVYGPTETTTYCTWHEVKSVEENALTVPIGYPLAGMRGYVLDEQRRPVPIGIPGELYIGGSGLARGYWKRPELTEERFVKDPFVEEAGARMYRTGDRVRRRADGTIEFMGRCDDQVKIRGFRIEPDEVATVLREHELVREAAVVVREDEPGEKRLAGYVVAAADALDEEGMLVDGQLVRPLLDYMKGRLPEYMVPSALMVLERIPLTANGKVDRRALPRPEQTRDELSAEYVAPRNETEEQLVEIWEEVLKVDRVGVHDNFFDLGGHSLMATQVMNRIKDQFGKRVELIKLFQHPTIGELAGIIHQSPVAAGGERDQGVL